MKRLVMAMVGLCVANAVAMPTQVELKKAQPLVAELMAPTLKDFKEAGAKEKAAAAVKVADASAEFAKAAETEAAKFLLLKGAVSFYTRGEAYDQAADALAVLLSEVKDVPPAVVAEIAGKATGRISETKAPRLFALYRKARLQVRAASEAKTLAQKLKKVKSDALQRRYAEALAVSGNWKKAYAEFAKLSDAKLKVIVDAEAKGNAKNAESGEFWWAYKPDFDDAEDLFKAHAAVFYRKALAADEITGLKKNIVEQRIKEYDVPVVVAGGEGVSPRTPAANGLYCVIDLSGGPDAKKYPVSYLNDMPKGGWSDEYKTTKLVLRRIEPGSFMMGEKDKGRHVAIKEAFYMGVFEVTQKQWSLIIGDRPSFWKGPQWSLRPVEQVTYDRIRGENLGRKWPESDEVDEYSFMWLLRQKTGLRFDLPREAQWEYACRAGTDTDYYTGEQCKEYWHDSSADKIGRYMRNGGWDEEKWGKFEWGKAWSAPDRDCTSEHGTASVGTYIPNNWGLYDMSGNVAEMCLDRFVHEPKPNEVFRASRGGRWFAFAAELKSNSREQYGCGSNDRWFGHGLRLCLSLAGGAVPTGSVSGVGKGKGGKGIAPVTVKEKPIVVKLKTGVEIEFMPCPAGSFEMGFVENPQSPNFKHSVHITRPFWLGKYQVTRKQWSAFRNPGKVDDLLIALGGLDSVKDWVSYNEAMGFCEFLNKKRGSILPKGYVYRLPTEAEWEYACRANCSDAGDLYVRYANGQNADFGDVAVDKSDYDKASKANIGIKFGPDWAMPPMKPGMKSPNGWGLFDMVGNGREYTLDIYDVPEFCKRLDRNECDHLDVLAYAPNAEDPLHYVDSDSRSLCSVTRSHSYGDSGTRKLLSRIHEGDNWWGTFRVCIGPDLVSEWKAKNGKK